MSKVEVWSYDQITNPEFKTEIAKTLINPVIKYIKNVKYTKNQLVK